MSASVLVGGRHVSVTDVALVCTAVPGGRAYAQVALEPAALAALAKAAADLGAAAGAAPAPAVPAFAESTAASVPLLPAALARAAVLARVVHALQGRSGLRPQLVQFFADCLNADVHFALPASDAAGLSGYLLAAAYGGPQLPPGLAAELAAKGVTHPAPGPTAPLALSYAEVGALRLGSASLALAGGAALVLGGAVEASGCADAVAALCCAGAKGGVPLELWALDGLYEGKPHRSLAASAQAFKVLLRDSPPPPPAAAAAAPDALTELPAVHGPAAEALTAAAKAAAVELNGCEKGPLGVAAAAGGAPTPSLRGVAASCLRAGVSALSSLAAASRRRLSTVRAGVAPWSPNGQTGPSPDALEPMALLLCAWEALAALQQATVAEAAAAVHAIHAKAAAAQEAAQAAEAAGAGGGGGDSAGGGGGAVAPEVAAKLAAAAAAEEAKKAAMKPDERERYERKLAEKEAKAAAKKATKDANKTAKGASAAGGAAAAGPGAAEAAAAAAAAAAARVAPGVSALLALLGVAGGVAGGASASSASASEGALALKLSCWRPTGAWPSLTEDVDTLRERLGSGHGQRRSPKIAKGTRDFGPEQMKVRSGAFAAIRGVFDRHGAVEIDTPVFELKETLTGKYGEDSKLIYDLADQGGELLALRYDLTVPFARFLAMHSVGNIKRFHIAKVYRRDNPQLARGRYREFYQCDFDIAGSYLPMVADAEVITVAKEILSALPIGTFVIKLNHRVLLDAVFELCGVPSDKFRTICSAVDKLDKEPWSEVRREMVEDKGLGEASADAIGTFVTRKGAPRAMLAELVAAGIFAGHAAAEATLGDMAKLFDYLDAMGSLAVVSFDMSLARGLDYYTGVIYECVHTEPNGPGVGSIAAGGRYDKLVGMFSEGGQQVPCVGVSVGVERIFAILEANAVGKATRGVDVFVASVGKGMLAARMAAARALWAAGISAEFWQNKENPRFAGPGSQLDYVLKLAIPVVVIVGEAEAASGRVKVKAIKYSKDGEAAGGGKDGEDGGVEVPLAGLAAYVAALLGKTATAAATAAPATPAAAATAGATPAAAPAGLLRPPPSKAEAAAVCLAPSVGLSATAKFAVLDLAHLAGRSVLAAPAAPPAAPPAEKAPAQQAAAEDEDEMDLGFDDEEDEDAPKAAAVVHAPGSRGALAAEAKAKRDAETEVKKQEAMARLAKKEANQRSLCNLEIKPWEASQDLKALYAKIQATVVMEGLKWSENCALVDVAFGVQKIVCTAVIPLSLSMDAIIDEMTEETFVDEIQSMNMTSMSLL